MVASRRSELIRVLSAGAVEPGLTAAADAFNHRHGIEVELMWATTPTIRQRVGAGEVFDLLVLPQDAAAELTKAGKLTSDKLRLGSVGVGVAVRMDVSPPDISDVAHVEEALLSADRILFTRATSGTYVESMLKRQGLYDRLLPRILRFVTGPEMMDRLINGGGNEICLGAIVELMMFRDQGVRYAGPLPEAINHYTTYEAALMQAAPNPASSRTFLRYLAADEACAEFAACGVKVASA